MRDYGLGVRPARRAVALAALLAGAVVGLSACATGAAPGGAHRARQPHAAAGVSTTGAAHPASTASSAPTAGATSAARTPVPPPDPCAANTAAQLVLVSVGQQHAWYCAGQQDVFNTPVTTGMDTPNTETPLGHFTIEGKDTGVVLHPAAGGAYPVKYWIPFQAPLYGFHDSSWQTFPYGSPQYRTGGSHGCVHLPLPAIEYLYSWAQVGAAVDIRA